jgi:AcrR family transcriptional regulator
VLTDAFADPAPEVRTRDAERTRTAILRAAVAEFAALGPGGARTEAIAARAGVNKKLLYYYFANKDDLFLAAIELAYADIRSAERQLRLDTLEPADAVRSLVAFTWRHYVEHPEFMRLLESENLAAAAHLKRSTRVRDLNSPLVPMLADVVARGERAGLFRAGIDPLQLYVSIAGLAYFYLSNNHTLSTIFGRDLREPAAMEDRLAHITDVVMAYVLAR